MNTKGLLVLALMVLLVGNLATARAATTATPATKIETPKVLPKVLEGMITGVRGLVQVRHGNDQPWVKATTGMKITQGASFRTGPRSAVQFQIPPDQTVTLDRLGTITLLRAVAEAGKIKTDLGMKYGRTRYDIRKAGFEHESTIRSPSATLSVRGTRVGIQDGASGFVAWSTQSRAYLQDRSSRRTLTFGEHAQVRKGSKNAAGESKQRGTIDPGDARSRYGPEHLLLALRPGGDSDPGGSHGRFGLPRLPLPPRGFAFPEQRIVPGSLRFELMWQSSFATDLDLYVRPPSYTGDRPISVFRGTVPGDVTRSRSGGHVDPKLGDATTGNPVGREAIQWDGQFPTGKFVVGVSPFDLGQASNQPYQIDVLAKGPNQVVFTKIQTIQATAVPNVTHEHDVVVGGLAPPKQLLTNLP